MSSPSIIPNDRLDRDFYIVLENFAGGAAFRETDEDYDYHTLITDLLLGQFGQVLRVVGFNPAEGWSRDDSPHKRLPDEIRWADPAPLAFSPPSAWPSPHVVATFRLPAKPAQSYCRSR